MRPLHSTMNKIKSEITFALLGTALITYRIVNPMTRSRLYVDLKFLGYGEDGKSGFLDDGNAIAVAEHKIVFAGNDLWNYCQ